MKNIFKDLGFKNRNGSVSAPNAELLEGKTLDEIKDGLVKDDEISLSEDIDGLISFDGSAITYDAILVDSDKSEQVLSNVYFHNASIRNFKCKFIVDVNDPDVRWSCLFSSYGGNGIISDFGLFIVSEHHNDPANNGVAVFSDEYIILNNGCHDGNEHSVEIDFDGSNTKVYLDTNLIHTEVGKNIFFQPASTEAMLHGHKYDDIVLTRGKFTMTDVVFSGVPIITQEVGQDKWGKIQVSMDKTAGNSVLPIKAYANIEDMNPDISREGLFGALTKEQLFVSRAEGIDSILNLEYDRPINLKEFNMDTENTSSKRAPKDWELYSIIDGVENLVLNGTNTTETGSINIDLTNIVFATKYKFVVKDGWYNTSNNDHFSGINMVFVTNETAEIKVNNIVQSEIETTDGNLITYIPLDVNTDKLDLDVKGKLSKMNIKLWV